MGFTVETDTVWARQRVRITADRAVDFRPVWNSVIPYLIGRTKALFAANAHGGTYRGVTWEWFADQYTRQTDGVTVPAEGGVPRLRGGISAYEITGAVRRSAVASRIGERRGAMFGAPLATRSDRGRSALMSVVREARTDDEPFVRGKRRPSGARVTAESLIMQDTGALLAAAGQSNRISPSELVTAVNVGYAGEMQRQRPFWFIEQGVDDVWIRSLAADWLAGTEPVAAPAGSMLAALERMGV